MSSLESFVDYWFDEPGEVSTPEQDRIYVYASCIMMLSRLRRSSLSGRELKKIHNFFTYLLLGWNPITAWPKHSEFPETESKNEVMPCWDKCKETMKELLDFDSPVRNVYPILVYLENCCNKFGNESLSLFTGERITMTTLAMTLFDRSFKMKIPADDLSIIRACLDLYYRSKGTACTESMQVEYARANHSLGYCKWLSNQVNRLLQLNVSRERLLETLTYCGWFISLIKTSRILKTSARNTEWVDEVTSVLAAEATELRNILDESPNNCNGEQPGVDSDVSKSSRLFSVFRIKPPPVKIRITKNSNQTTKEKKT